MTILQFSELLRRNQAGEQNRRGVFLVIGAICLAVCLTFVAFTVDLGIASLTKTEMQGAVDSAALAAAMEITNAINTAGSNVANVFEYAKQQAAAKAVTVAQLNHTYINSSTDVKFGRRYWNASTSSYVIDWNAASNQVNVVKVIARRDSTNKKAPDAKLPAMFAGLINQQGTTLRAEAISYIEPRDMVVVHDFSRSMNFDSYFTDETTTRLSQSQIESNLQLIYTDLQPLNLGTMTFAPQYYSKQQSNTGANATVTFKGKSVAVSTNTKLKSVKIYFTSTSSQTFTISNETTTSGTYAGTGSNANKRIIKVDLTIRKVGSSSQTWSLTNYANTASNVMAGFGLNSVTYPYTSGSWSDFIDYAQTNSALPNYGYQDMYGGMTFICYLLKETPAYSQNKQLWKTRHYPFHAIKEGHELLCDFLTDLGFDDRLGMVSYDSNHRVETTISDSSNPDMPSVNISSAPISKDFVALKKLMHYKQAAHYSSSTNMGGGLKDAISLLDTKKRVGSRPTIILMTDGNANTWDSGESGSLPSGWNWNDLLDYNGDGNADFTTSNSYATNVLKYVKQAVDKGYTVHAISVGADADRDLLQAIAWLGNGYAIDVPGGMSVSDMEDQVRAAFSKIASAVPPARLVPQ